MSPIPDDFEQLRRLLALKRYEQPPPGYFHGFSRQVILRIQAGELGDAAEASLWSFSGGSFFQRIWATLDARPALAGAFGVAVCGFFVVGALLSDSTGTATAANTPPPAQTEVAQRPTLLWEQPKAHVQYSSLIGTAGVPNDQADTSSLFKEIETLQAVTSQDRPVDLRLLLRP
jgi:hypothetical protein